MINEDLREQLYKTLIGLKPSINAATASKSNCHYNIGQSLNQLRHRYLEALDDSEAKLLALQLPCVEFSVPKAGELAVWTVSSLEALRLYSQLATLLSHEKERLPTASKNTYLVSSSKKVFLVHGHDEAAREIVARFVERVGCEVIILHEQANSGNTVIEKLEKHAEVTFAIVLLTPDDEGRKVGDADLLKRARQNVVLELGYFLGRLGRKCVCALHKGAVEIPSDYLGVLFIPFDEAGGWRLRLAQEMHAAGLQIDVNKVL